MKAAELALAALIGGFVALAIVAAVSSVLNRLEPVSVVLVDPPAAGADPAKDLDLERGK